jgi:hypothetical protein
MSNSTSIHPQPVQRKGRRPAASWRHRVLSWVYPNREWGVERPTVEPEPVAKKTVGRSAKAAGFETGQTR